jgi:hypothetical protein
VTRDDRTREDHRTESERDLNEKPVARSVATKLKKLRARLAKKEAQEKAAGYRLPSQNIERGDQAGR